MVNLELFESILEDDFGYIEENDVLTEEFFERMSKYPPSRVEKLFKRMKPTSTMFALKLIRSCEKCGKEVEKITSKTEVIKMLRKEIKFECCVCIAEEKERKKIEEYERKLKKEEEYEANLVENTCKYIEKFLTPESTWVKGIKNYDKLLSLRSISSCDKKYIEDYIKQMEYKEFLKTPYWKAISEKVKIKSDFRCSLCNADKNLSVHHRTYSIHGNELDNMQELICICQNCHEKHHDIY